MCNLYRMTRSAAEVAQLFELGSEPTASNVPAEIYPGYPGLVIAGGELLSMVWGFPLTMKSKRTGAALKPKPVNNARTDKLDSGFWRNSFEQRRCLIPLTAFAEAEGPRGAKTRTWLSLPDRPVFAAAGIWRSSAEWGEVYSMVMTGACERTEEVHDRMPVILDAADHTAWTEGSTEEARALCVPWSGDIAIERTADPWVRRSG